MNLNIIFVNEAYIYVLSETTLLTDQHAAFLSANNLNKR